MTAFFLHHGLPLLFLAVLLESFGLPLPGETALIAFGVLASQGDYSIFSVIALAATAAIVGDNLGYWLIGRVGGRALLERWGWLNRYVGRFLPPAERLMQRHGGKAVFFGRFIAVVRFTIVWIAGLTGMPWLRFLCWNAAGGIAWATSVGLIAFYGGRAAATAISRYGLYAAIGVGAIVLGGWFVLRRAKGRLEHRAEAPPGESNAE